MTGVGLGDRRQLGLGRQVAEHLVEELAELRSVDVADGDDLQRVLGEDALAVALEIVVPDGGDGLFGAVGGTRVGVPLEGQRIPLVLRDLVGVAGGVDEAGDELLADALDRVGLEVRLVERELEELGGVVAVCGECLEVAVEGVLGLLVAHAHGDILHALLELARGKIAGALVQHGRDEIGEAFLADRVLRAAAVEGEAHGHHRHRVLLDEPGLDAAGALDSLNFHGVCGRARCGKEGDDSG